MEGYARLSTDGKTISAREAKRRHLEKGLLRCLDPECETCVFPRVGDKRKPHFVHYSASDERRCKRGVPHGETIEHLTAKHFVADTNAACTFFDHRCYSCRAMHAVPNTRALATSVEHRVQTGSGRFRVADVMLLRGDGTPVYAIEIRHTHAVEPEKTSELRSVGVHVIEVDSTAVLDASTRRLASGGYSLFTTDYHYKRCDMCYLQQQILDPVADWEAWYDTACYHELQEQWRQRQAAILQQRRELERLERLRIQQEEEAERQRLERERLERLQRLCIQRDREEAERLRIQRDKQEAERLRIAELALERRAGGIADAKQRMLEASSNAAFNQSQGFGWNTFTCIGCTKTRAANEHEIRRTFVGPRGRACRHCWMPCPVCGANQTMQTLADTGVCPKCL